MNKKRNEQEQVSCELNLKIWKLIKIISSLNKSEAAEAALDDKLIKDEAIEEAKQVVKEITRSEYFYLKKIKIKLKIRVIYL